MEEKTVTSPLWKLNYKDFLRGLLMAALSAPFTLIVTSIQAGEFNLDWEKIGITAAIAAATYLAKNLGTPATVQIPIKDENINPNDKPAAK